MPGRGSAVELNPFASPALEEAAARIYLAAGIDDRFADPRELARAVGYRVRPVSAEGPRIALPRNVLCYVDDPDPAVWGESCFTVLARALGVELDEDESAEALTLHLAAPPSLVRFYGRLTVTMQPHLPRWRLRSWTRWWL